MKKLVVISTLLLPLIYSPNILAKQHSFHLGYTGYDFSNKLFSGINASYRYEFEDKLGVFTTISWVNGKSSFLEQYNFNEITVDKKFDYISLLSGPSLRVNAYLSIYGALGFHFLTSNEFKKTSAHGITEINSSRGLAWGGGFLINPIDSVSIHLGYEGSRTLLKRKEEVVKGFNIGIGYRF